MDNNQTAGMKGSAKMKRILQTLLLSTSLAITTSTAKADVIGVAWQDLGGGTYKFYSNVIFHPFIDPALFPYDAYMTLDGSDYTYTEVLNNVAFGSISADGSAFNSWGVTFGSAWTDQWLTVTISGLADGQHYITGTDITGVENCGSWNAGCWPTGDTLTVNLGAVPIPAAVWLFGSGLIGLIGIARRKKA